jgi:hypothetical protein
MSTTTVGRGRRRASRGSRRAGYVVSILLNLAVLYAINTWPGWDAVPFLTGETADVIGWVNLSIWVGVAANVLYLLADPVALRALGDVVTTAVGVVVVVRVWQVFPFDVSSGWELVLRVLLVLGMVGSGIGILVALGRFGRAVTGRGDARG